MAYIAHGLKLSIFNAKSALKRHYYCAQATCRSVIHQKRSCRFARGRRRLCPWFFELFLHIYHSNGFWWATTTECLGRKHAHYSCMLPTEKLTILLVGSGGREHAIAWRLAQSERVAHIYVAPGKQPILSRVKMQFLTGRPRQRRYRPWRQSDQCRDWCQRLSQVDRVRHQEQCKIQGAVPLQKK